MMNIANERVRHTVGVEILRVLDENGEPGEPEAYMFEDVCDIGVKEIEAFAIAEIGDDYGDIPTVLEDTKALTEYAA